ncbi:helix-hairpin-helix domain-containing protein [Chloroflexota bacterium]
MSGNRFDNFWIAVVFLLIAVIITGSIIVVTKYTPNQPIEISLTPAREFNGKIYVGGEVPNPGFYPLKADDTLWDIIQAAGGTANNTDLNQLSLQIHHRPVAASPQKININTAEAWLLKALPGIGDTKAQAIIEYREQNEEFRDTAEIMKVAGIGPEIYGNIKHLITVAD